VRCNIHGVKEIKIYELLTDISILDLPLVISGNSFELLNMISSLRESV
jgi:hypothetical protein